VDAIFISVWGTLWSRVVQYTQPK